MPRLVTALVAALTLVLGFAVARAMGQQVGAVVLVLGVAACVALQVGRTRWWRLVVVGLVGAAAFAASHLLADALGPWPAVLLAAALTGAAAYVLTEAPRPDAVADRTHVTTR